MLAGVFIGEGNLKLADPAWLGAGRFAKIVIPWPEFTGLLLGWTELVCGLLLVLGLFSRLSAIPVIIVMIIAILSKKFPILLGRHWWIFSLRKLDRYGFLA